MRRVEQPDTTSHGETPDLRADISLLNRAARAFNGVLEPRGHLRGIIEELREALHADGWSLWISDAAAGNAVCSMAEGLNGPSPPVDTHIAIGEGPVGWTLLHQTTLAVADVRVAADAVLTARMSPPAVSTTDRYSARLCSLATLVILNGPLRSSGL